MEIQGYIKCPSTETWKDIEGYKGFYQVSNLGNIRSLDRRIIYSDGRVFNYKGKILRKTLNRGYEYVKISKNSIVKTLKVHRLVALAFIPNPLNLEQVNHKDEIKTNNGVNNLEWCTAKYNVNYGTGTERTKKNTDYKMIADKRRNKNGKTLYQYSLNGKLIKTYPAIREAARNGFDRGAIHRCIIGKVNSHKGYVFSLNILDERKDKNGHKQYRP
ncbi:NUMOD4 domain-containing protein [Clostridium sp. DL1XJH146]